MLTAHFHHADDFDNADVAHAATVLPSYKFLTSMMPMWARLPGRLHLTNDLLCRCELGCQAVSISQMTYFDDANVGHAAGAAAPQNETNAGPGEKARQAGEVGKTIWLSIGRFIGTS